MRNVVIMILTLLSLCGSAVTAADIDRKMLSAGMVDVGAMDSTLVVELMYASEHNFVGADMYGPLRRAYLHPEAADALVKASAILARDGRGLRIKVCDAARPMSVQKRMYDKVRRTPSAPYVSNPANGGGLHNYGLAVDVTLVDSLGRELPMGTPVDHLGPEANIDREERLVAAGTISREELSNRRLLRRVMREAGFMPLRSEWWHFNLRSRATARARYRVLDF